MSLSFILEPASSSSRVPVLDDFVLQASADAVLTLLQEKQWISLDSKYLCRGNTLRTWNTSVLCSLHASWQPWRTRSESSVAEAGLQQSQWVLQGNKVILHKLPWWIAASRSELTPLNFSSDYCCSILLIFPGSLLHPEIHHANSYCVLQRYQDICGEKDVLAFQTKVACELSNAEYWGIMLNNGYQGN